MGASAKTLSRLVSLHQRGCLPSGGSIVELGAQELHCSGAADFVQEVLQYFTDTVPDTQRCDGFTRDEIEKFSNKGLFGKLLTVCGFQYLALDIFEADRTMLFDLNLHTPGPELCAQFDLVTNLGTTEHLINQYQALKTMHELARPGGLLYHDLPLSGYHYHGYFSYNPLLFRDLAAANNYTIVLEHFSKGTRTAVPESMTQSGYSEAYYDEFGIEVILRKNGSAPFRMPLETSTSLGVSKSMWGESNPYVSQGAGLDEDFDAAGSGVSMYLATAPRRALQRELLRRLRRKLSGLISRS